MEPAKMTLYTFIGLAVYSLVTGYFSDREDAREHNERLVCIHAHGDWRDVDTSEWSTKYACVFPVQTR